MKIAHTTQTAHSSPDMERATRQLLRATRGARSQVAFSRRLGYRGNPVADWEAGRRFPTAEVWLRACTLSGIDVTAAFVQFHGPSAPSLGEPSTPDLARWLDVLRGSVPIVQLAERSGYSRFALGRWLSGRAKPRVHELLTVVEAITGRASDLVAALLPIDQVPELVPGYRMRSRARRLAFEQPWTEAILRMLEVSSFHLNEEPGPQALAHILDEDPERIREALDAMVESGVAREVDGALREAATLHVDTRGDPTGFNQLRRHWLEVASHRLAAPRDTDWFAYNIMTLSEDELAEAKEILRNAYRQIRGLAAASSDPRHALLLNVQLLEWSVTTHGSGMRSRRGL